MKKIYIKPETKLSESVLHDTFMDQINSWGSDGDHEPIKDDDDPDEIFGKERNQNEYSLW